MSQKVIGQTAAFSTCSFSFSISRIAAAGMTLAKKIMTEAMSMVNFSS